MSILFVVHACIKIEEHESNNNFTLKRVFDKCLNAIYDKRIIY